MNSILKFLKATFLGGILFLVPLVILLVFFEKGYSIIHKISLPIVNHLPKVKVLGVGLQELAAIFIIVIICFVAGIIARSSAAVKFNQKIEDKILSHIPGYSFIKKINENIMGFESNEDLKVVLVPTDAGWQFAFIVEQINENNFTVFIPDAPSPWSGSLCFVEKANIREIDITQKQALDCIKKLGYGSADLLKNQL